jgi:transcriptional regulator with XRE-family HTH domain
VAITVGRRKRSESRYLEQASRLATRIRELRQHAGMTQEQLAARAGVSVSTLRKIEDRRVAEPGYFTITAILHALGVSHEEINL